ncbi:trypsin-like peptidase domain-containing protein [Streptomyces bicolor]|uniref:trypsin-like peptidase domain-containing protein n=1 Tax=Streptomyces bicolor TaxID=66874 RepID=UPI0004E1A89C|nr:trypsin-like peptidase domain-containing protein [Streptomyces bicolor]
MRRFTVRQVAADLRAGAGPLVLVCAGVFAGLAPLLGLDSWVSPAAAAVALLSGVNVIRSDVLAPARARGVARAVHPLHTGVEGSAFRPVANALQIAAGVWVAPAHVLHEGGGYQVVLPDGAALRLRPLHREAGQDLAVFGSDTDWPWTARPQWSPPEPGERITVVGWLLGSAVATVQAATDLTAQESQAPGLVTMLGPAPPAGSSGSALIAARTGRVIGVLTGVGALDRRQRPPGAGDSGIVIGVLLATVPVRFRSRAAASTAPSVSRRRSR